MHASVSIGASNATTSTYLVVHLNLIAFGAFEQPVFKTNWPR
jgi:hypothetical protein